MENEQVETMKAPQLLGRVMGPVGPGSMCDPRENC